MRTRYRLALLRMTPEGEYSEVFSRFDYLDGEDLKAEEYGLAMKSKEVYRDAMHARGLWLGGPNRED